MWRTALRFLAGAALGTIVWWYAAPSYDDLTTRSAAILLRADPRLRDVEAAPRDRWTLFRSATGAFPPALTPTDQLTYNLILFVGLLATRRRLLRDRNIRLVAIGIAAMFIVHILAVAVVAESTYSMAQGDWSDAHYSDFEEGVWLYAAMFYRLAGMFAVPFGIWWLTRDPEP